VYVFLHLIPPLMHRISIKKSMEYDLFEHQDPYIPSLFQNCI
jgi:hypothetical protein